ncbi:ribbon-helix-helix domain-containing protein [Caballeronia terrestris]|uniref:ribbon-helix-helix domain-containing protein n=1 Tax=Caballeronia terrestris TaxID=1226301 RepID=UPI000ABBAC68|nr:CopG family transcriptional regulator [Caballeronia terrestris]
MSALTNIAKAEGRSRAAVIRDAIDAYVSQHKADVFGIWKHKQIDGLQYQRQLRSEW